LTAFPPACLLFLDPQGNTGEQRNCVNEARCYSRKIRQRVHKLFKNRPGFKV